MNNVVLVHGAFVDGSGWEGVYKVLRRDGYSVSIVQNPTIIVGGRRSGYQSNSYSAGRTYKSSSATPTEAR
jgi:hypothetical protein